jgi:ribosomal protein S12 methylthiotransferase
LNSLLRGLSRIDGIEWIRVLYAHPKTMDDSIINEIGQNDRVCKYIDLPIQHICSRILHRMNRGTTRAHIENIIKKLKRIRGISIRTTIIVGFPGETDAEFDELMDFIEEYGFDWLGVFPYYCESATSAAALNQVPEVKIKERYEKALAVQKHLIEEANHKRLGHQYKVLLHSGAGRSYVGHAEFCAPDIDSQISIEGEKLRLGTFYDCRITHAVASDLKGELARISS